MGPLAIAGLGVPEVIILCVVLFILLLGAGAIVGLVLLLSRRR